MAMTRQKRRRRSTKTLLLINDGTHWHGGLRSGESWQVHSEAVDKAHYLPVALLRWAVERDAGHVRIAAPEPLHEFALDGSNPMLMNPAELYQGLSWPLAEVVGMEPDDVAPAAVSVESLGLSDDPLRMIGAAIHRDDLHQYERACLRAGLVLDGVTSLAGLLLADHIAHRSEEQEGLLVFADKASWIFGFNGEELVPTFRSITLSAPGVARPDSYLRKLERRIKTYLRHPLCVVNVCEPESQPAVLQPSAAAAATVAVLDESCRLRPIEFADRREPLFDRLAAAKNELLEGTIGLAGHPPKVRDSRDVGSVICIGSILITAVAMASLYGVRVHKKHEIESLREAVAIFESERASARSDYESVDAEVRRIRNLHQLLSQEPEKVSGKLNAILAALAEAVPQYSRIVAIEQDPQGEMTRVEGTTLWQKELSDFTVGLQERLRPHDLRVVPKEAESEPGSEQTRFTFEIHSL